MTLDKVYDLEKICREYENKTKPQKTSLQKIRGTRQNQTFELKE